MNYLYTGTLDRWEIVPPDDIANGTFTILLLPSHVKLSMRARSNTCLPIFLSFWKTLIVYFDHMIIDNNIMEIMEEDALLGQESEDENSEMSDGEVNAYC